MAQAVQQLWPAAKLGIGPPIENGFYYDFDVETPFVPEDLVKIESAMRKIIKENQRFERRVTTDADAINELQDEPYKLELIGLKGGRGRRRHRGRERRGGRRGAELTIYDNVGRSGEAKWSDLCRGPHIPTTKRIPAFKLMRTAAAYWRGDEKNKQLQRIYGTAWETKEALDEHLHRIEEAERRDHRKLGRDLDLYSFPDEIGSGLPVFHPKGGVIKREMEDYVRQRHIEEGFEYVGTPHIAKEGLFYTSGHLPYYGEAMFPALDVDGMDYRLKAMNCPMHNLIYRSAAALLPRAAAAVLRVRVASTATRSPASCTGSPASAGSPRTTRTPTSPPSRRRLRSSTCSTSAWACSGTSGSTTSTSSCRPATTPSRTSSSVPTRTGRWPPRCWRRWPPTPVSSSFPTRAGLPTTARRSPCRPGTRSVAPGRCRPSSTTSTNPHPNASTSSTSPPMVRASSR